LSLERAYCGIGQVANRGYFIFHGYKKRRPAPPLWFPQTFSCLASTSVTLLSKSDGLNGLVM
jgi:hypothetical protein